MPTGRPAENEYAPYFARYVGLVPEADVLAALEGQIDDLRRFAKSVPPEREGHRYAPDKWSVREVIGHLADGERVFGYRVFCISRGEQQALPSFDENAYVAQSAYGRVPLADLAEELVMVRRANLAVMRRLEPPAWTRLGTASGQPVSVRALGYIMVGHPRHHLAILRERYGLA
ncbi:MAG TPA: DinB family protein [Vicinamibacteria bacterium]|nr:DinB family protein [Vicinamibacteria bacterium]